MRSKTRIKEEKKKRINIDTSDISSRYKKAKDSKDFDAMLFSFIEEELSSNDKK